MPSILGIITIGQAPRDDIASLFAMHAPTGTKVVLRGASTGSRSGGRCAETESGADHALHPPARRPRRQDLPEGVIARSPAAFAKLRADGCDVLVYACTGDFPPWRATRAWCFLHGF